MERKKKKEEEPEIYHTPFGSTVLPPPDYFEPRPYIIDPSYMDVTTMDVTTLGDTRRRYITTTYPGSTITYTGSTGDVSTVYHPAEHWGSYSTTLDYEDFMKEIGKEEETKVEIIMIKSSKKGEHIASCQNKQDLSVDRVLNTLSAVKGRLMLDVAFSRIQKIECSISPAVRKNIVTASKKLKMYGKTRPIIARFDDYGNRLPDEIELGTSNGVALKIVDPKIYKDYYLEIKVIEFSDSEYEDYFPF